MVAILFVPNFPVCHVFTQSEPCIHTIRVEAAHFAACPHDMLHAIQHRDRGLAGIMRREIQRESSFSLQGSILEIVTFVTFAWNSAKRR